jgi:hypothetical protein
MNKIGRKVFYELTTGNIIIDTGERQGSVIATSIQQDIATFTALSERNRDTFDVMELPFGAYQQDFAECNGYRVNVETGELEFSYPDPNVPDAEPVFVKPLSEEVKGIQSENAELIFQNAMQDMSISSLQSENADLIFRIATIEMGGM